MWAKLSRNVRGDDHKLFRVQSVLSTVTNLVVQATDALLKAESDPKRLKVDHLVRMSTDAVALISHASYISFMSNIDPKSCRVCRSLGDLSHRTNLF